MPGSNCAIVDHVAKLSLLFWEVFLKVYQLTVLLVDCPWACSHAYVILQKVDLICGSTITGYLCLNHIDCKNFIQLLQAMIWHASWQLPPAITYHALIKIKLNSHLNKVNKNLLQEVFTNFISNRIISSLPVVLFT
jgi:hypothetical protein